ncbi:MAG TPA: DUF3311 domain-containing protein [Phycisphaerae bacterium]|nr:DUF3311 domain-containing protein [Phycisphaerae bacterium]
MRKLVYAAIILLALAHQDFWWWNDIHPLVFGFIPVGLAYQALVSILAALLWWAATRYCWPRGVDDDGFATGE